MKVHIITIFDKNYVGRAHAFRTSLHEYAPEYEVRFLCLDNESFEMCRKLNLGNTIIMKAEDLNDRELMQAKSTRTLPEFASTVKPAALLYMMKSGIVAKNDLAVFIDPDFFFYTSPKGVFEKMFNNGSITITSHRFSKKREPEQFMKGIYNAGIVAFKNDESALTCLEEWRKQCIAWCYLRYEDGKIGDQGYLSAWPQKYKNVYELPDKGVNLSTWNIENYKVTRNTDGKFFIDDEPLIAYHFHGLKFYFDRKGHIHASPVTVYHREIYKPCVRSLDEAYKQIRAIDPSWKYGTVARPNVFKLIRQRIQRATA